MKKTMKLAHSLSTRPWRLNVFGFDGMLRLIGTVWYYSLSVAYALRIGAEIELHTDTLGERLLGHLPYTRIYTDLDDMPSNISSRFWAAGKMFALGNMDLGDVHIDGDVFFKKRSLLDDLERAPWDVLAQSVEDEQWVRSCYIREMKPFRIVPDVCESICLSLEDCKCAYNTGAVGFRMETLRRAFVNGYKTVVSAVSEAAGSDLDNSLFSTPDLVAEQLYIRQVAEAGKAEVRMVVDDPFSDLPAKIGYQHVLTSRKYAHIDRVKALLEVINPKIYANTKKLCHT